MLSTANTSFSAIQGTLLSKLAPDTISIAAFSISAVSSTTTGGFPAPAPIAFFPDDKTVFTINGPPVATSNLTLGLLIIRLVFSIEGSFTIVIIFLGAPYSSKALFIILTNFIETFFALG